MWKMRPANWVGRIRRSAGTTWSTTPSPILNLRWSHPSTASASGLLATLAEFYAASGVTRGLTPEDLQKPETVARLQEMEGTVSYYGEGEWAARPAESKRARAGLSGRLCRPGTMVVWLNQQGHEIVAIYPAEGSLWEDHPLALLEVPGLGNDQRSGFRILCYYLESTEARTGFVQRLSPGRSELWISREPVTRL